MTPREQRYGRFRIRVGTLTNVWTARAFNAAASSARGTVHEATGKDADTAVEALKLLIDEAATTRRQGRRVDSTSSFAVPTAEEYREALAVLRLTPRQRRMLEAHAAAGDAGLTATELAEAAPYRDSSAANLHYGKCGGSIAEELGIAAPEAASGDGPVLTGVLASAGPPREDGSFVWVMHPELREALGAS